MPGFATGLNETGYVEGKNVAIEFRWAEGHYDRLPALAADLVRRRVAVLVCGRRRGAGRQVGDLDDSDRVYDRQRPRRVWPRRQSCASGRQPTGISFVTTELAAKRLELLHELVPKATVIAMIVNPECEYRIQGAKVQEAARSLGLQLQVLSARTEQEIDAAFATLAQLRAGALLVDSDPFFNARREQFVALAAHHAVPAIYEGRESVAAGGLMSYGGNIPEAYRQAGIYAGKILNGAKPADLPVLQSTKVELVINLKTAKALGLTIPQSLLLRADEVIQ